MKKTNETDALNNLIIILEQQHDKDLLLLKEQLHLAYESVKPINFIKKLVHEVTTSPEIKEDVLGNVMGLATGFISRQFMVDKKSSGFKKVFATLAQLAIGNAVSKHSTDIRAVGIALYNNFFNKNKH